MTVREMIAAKKKAEQKMIKRNKEKASAQNEWACSGDCGYSYMTWVGKPECPVYGGSCPEIYAR